MTECVHRAVERAVFAIPDTLVVILTVIVSVCIVADFTLSFKAALDLRDILIGLEKAKEEMERIQKRLDVIIAVANDEWELRKLERESYVEELMDNLERRFVHIKERISIDPGAFVEDVREELMELRGKYLMEKEERMRFKHIKDFWQRNLIKGNPGMKSRRFEEALEELKKVVEEYRK